MNNEWLSTSSFEQMHEIISAINILSIHAKLILAAVDDPAKKNDVNNAKETLRIFIERFQNLIQSSEKNSSGIIFSADPRLGKLAVRYLSEKKHLSTHNILFNVSFDTLKELINSEKPDDLRQLIQYLKDLRSLVEQHSRADVTELLGEI